MARDFKEGEKFHPSDPWSVRVTKTPLISGEEIVNLSELCGITRMPVFAVREGPELEQAASRTVSVGKLVANTHFRNDGLSAAIWPLDKSISMLEVFVGREHGDKKFLEVENKDFELILA